MTWLEWALLGGIALLLVSIVIMAVALYRAPVREDYD